MFDAMFDRGRFADDELRIEGNGAGWNGWGPQPLEHGGNRGLAYLPAGLSEGRQWRICKRGLSDVADAGDKDVARHLETEFLQIPHEGERGQVVLAENGVRPALAGKEPFDCQEVIRISGTDIGMRP